MAALVTADLITETAVSQIDSTGKFTDTITVGLGANTAKTIIFDKGSGANNPRITYDPVTNSFNIDLKTLASFRIISGATVLMTLDSSGNFKVKGNFEANATI